MVDIIEEVKNGEQILFDRRDVVALLEAQREELISTACTHVVDEYDHIGRYTSVEAFVERLRRTMEGE